MKVGFTAIVFVTLLLVGVGLAKSIGFTLGIAGLTAFAALGLLLLVRDLVRHLRRRSAA